MAGDTRETPSSPPPKVYETFHAPPPSNAGAGGPSQKEEPTLMGAIKTVRLQDFKQVHMYPCARESLMMGIGGAFGVGCVRAICRAPVMTAANWAVGSFVVVTFANYEYCHYKRRLERQQIKRAIEIKEKQRAEKAQARREEEARRLKEEADRKAEAKRWWKLW